MSKIFSNILFVKKVSGRVQEGPRSPPDQLHIYLICHLFFMCLTYLCELSIVLSIVLPIVLPIELPIVLPIVLPIGLCAWGRGLRPESWITGLGWGPGPESEKVCGLCFREKFEV